MCSATKTFSKINEARSSEEAEREELQTFDLLARCEEDCLAAIAVDPGDKKACFRLAKCRDFQRRWRLRRDVGGAASVDGGDAEQDRRCALGWIAL